MRYETPYKLIIESESTIWLILLQIPPSDDEVSADNMSDDHDQSDDASSTEDNQVMFGSLKSSTILTMFLSGSK